MNVILLNSIIEKKNPMRGFGPYLLRHFLEKFGYSTQVIDYAHFFSEEEVVSMIEHFIEDDTVCFGVSTSFLMGSVLQEKIRNVVKKIKEKHPTIKIVLGGANAHRAVTSVPEVDCVCIGESEDILLELLNHWTKGDEAPIGQYDIVGKKMFYKQARNKRFNIETSDFIWSDRDCIVPGEALPLETSRGCIFKCKFCAYPLLGKKKFDYLRDVELIKNELISNYERFGTTSYYMLDDTFNDSEFKIDAFCDMVKTLPFKINFTAYIRMDLLSRFEGQAKKLKEAGMCATFFGIESFNQETSNAIGKGWHGKNAKDYLNYLLDDLWKDDVYISVSFIAGLPYETKETMQQTIDYLKNEKRINGLVWGLVIRKTTDSWAYYSEFDKDFEKFGYVLNADSSWKNEHWTSDEAYQVSADWWKHKNYPKGWFYSCWDYISLLGLGFDHSTIRTAMRDSSVMKDFPVTVLLFLDQYKKSLLALSKK